VRTTDAFNSISSSILLVKDENGNSYIPGTNTDNINVLHPGKGYKFITRQNVTFVYPNINFYYGPIINSNFMVNEPEIFKPKHTQTGFSANISVELIDTGEITGEIGVKNKNGEIVGSAIVAYPLTTVTIWGDNPLTDDIVEGAITNEDLSLVLFDKNKNTQVPLEVKKVINILDGKEVDKFIYVNDSYYYLQAKISEPNSVLVNNKNAIEVYPNPAKSDIHIWIGQDFSSASIKIIDEFGQKVKEIETRKMGYYSIDISELTAGVYIIIIDNGLSTKQSKFIKIK